MNTIKRDVYALRDTIKIPIEVTKGTDMVGFEFAVRDYSIPGTAAAVAYVYHKSMEKPKGILCDINDSTILHHFLCIYVLVFQQVHHYA